LGSSGRKKENDTCIQRLLLELPPMPKAHSSESARLKYCGWTCISHLTLTSGLVGRHAPSPNDLPPLLSPSCKASRVYQSPNQPVTATDRTAGRQAKARSAPLPAARLSPPSCWVAHPDAGTQLELWVAPLPCQVRTPSLQCEVPCRIARSSIGHRGRLILLGGWSPSGWLTSLLSS
jgi:hypothetical protein